MTEEPTPPPDAALSISLGVTRDQVEAVARRIRDGEDPECAQELRREHGKHRARLLNLMFIEDIPAGRRQTLKDLLDENHRREEWLNQSVSSAINDRNAQRMADVAESSNKLTEKATSHSSRMVDLATASNVIASNSETTAKALVRWTKVLAGATVILAVATVVLIFATLNA